MSDSMLKEAEDGDFDIAIVFVKRGMPKTMTSKAKVTLFGAVVTVMDMLNRMGASEATQKKVNELMELALLENAGRISNAEGRVHEPEQAQVQG